MMHLKALNQNGLVEYSLLVSSDVLPRVHNAGMEESIECTVYPLYLDSNVTSCLAHVTKPRS